MNIACERFHLLARCQERGYTLAEASPCIVSEEGDNLVVNVDHPAFPRLSRFPQPGTSLKLLLASCPLKIVAEPDCACLSRADEMDRMERQTPGWCRENIETIVGWLKEQADARGLPFSSLVAKLIVRRAIRTAYREVAKNKIDH
jgi:hypothetical protein